MRLIKLVLGVGAMLLLSPATPSATVTTSNGSGPQYCYRCELAPENDPNYPCNVCWHPVTGPSAVVSCVPYCNRTCLVGLHCEDTALRNPILAPDGSRLNPHLQDALVTELAALDTEDAELGDVGNPRVLRSCGEAIAAEVLLPAERVTRNSELGSLTI